MILVDSTIWIDHLRRGDGDLVQLLNEAMVLMHPFIRGELACGNLRQRAEILALLEKLPQIQVATDNEVLFFIEEHSLMGAGIGYVDAHLLAAVSLEGDARLWTRDKRLLAVAAALGLHRF